MSESNGQLVLCGWCLPEHSDVDRAHVSCCLRPPHHEGDHVIGEESGAAVNLYEVADDLAMTPVIHADLAPGERLGRDGLAALWALTVAGRADWVDDGDDEGGEGDE